MPINIEQLLAMQYGGPQGAQAPQGALAETLTMAQNAPVGQDNGLLGGQLQALLELFAPQFQDPSEEFAKQSRRRALGQFGAAMAAAPLGNLAGAIGRGGQAYGQSLYQQEQDEQRRLDLRSREEALSKYRGLTSAASMERARGSEEEPIDWTQLEGVLDPASLKALIALDGAGMKDEASALAKQLLYRGPEEEKPYKPMTRQEQVDFARDKAIDPSLRFMDVPGGRIGVDPKTGQQVESVDLPPKPPPVSQTPKSIEQIYSDLLTSGSAREDVFKAMIFPLLSDDEKIDATYGVTAKPDYDTALIKWASKEAGRQLSPQEAIAMLARKVQMSGGGQEQVVLQNEEVYNRLP